MTTISRRDLDAIVARLDVRCITWPFAYPAHITPNRCGHCDGCVANRWLERTKEPLDA